MKKIKELTSMTLKSLAKTMAMMMP
jgi:hypothetical protein